MCLASVFGCHFSEEQERSLQQYAGWLSTVCACRAAIAEDSRSVAPLHRISTIGKPKNACKDATYGVSELESG